MDTNILTLNNGVEMPQVGLGTFLIPREKLSRTIAIAYEIGYRKFDTAWRYHNEDIIAKALKDNRIPRENVFITTKVNADALYLWGYQYGKHRIFNIPRRSIRQAIEQSFSNLQTDYIDLFLVHWPWPMYLSMYKCLSKLYKEGRIRAIGVCSCLPPHIDSLSDISDVVPAVNQFEISPINAQRNLIDCCHRRGIIPEAMSTFSHFRSNEPRMEILDNEILNKIAEVHHKSVVQVVLRWLVQQKVSIIPKTWEDKHLRENLELFDFALSETEMSMISTLDKGKFLNYNPYNALINLPRKYRKKITNIKTIISKQCYEFKTT